MSENLEPLVSLNPSGNVYSHYDPQSRANAPLGENMTTLAETSKLSDDTIVTVYRGVPAGVQREIVPGDYVTTNPQLARDYAGNGDVLSIQIPMGDLLDDRDEPLGEEYIYRPQNSLTLSNNASLGERIERRAKELHSEKTVSQKTTGRRQYPSR